MLVALLVFICASAVFGRARVLADGSVQGPPPAAVAQKRVPVYNKADDAAQISSRLAAATDVTAGQLHDEWRADFVRDKGAGAQRPKPVKATDVEWYKRNGYKPGEAVRGADKKWLTLGDDGLHHVDIAAVQGKELSKLPAQIKASNLDSARFVQQDALKTLQSRGVKPTANGVADLLDDSKYMKSVSVRLHDRWMSQNSWARASHMDRSFMHLSMGEARKDVSIAARSLKQLNHQMGGSYAASVDDVTNTIMHGFNDISNSRLVRARYALRNRMRTAGATLSKGFKQAGSMAKRVWVDAPLAVVKRVPGGEKVVQRAAKSTSRMTGKAAAALGGKAMARLNAAGLIVQAGFMGHSIAESVKDTRLLEKALLEGDTHKAKRLKRSLRHMYTDALLGKGGTQGILSLGKMAKEGVQNHMHRCIGDFKSTTKERNFMHCMARTWAAPYKMVGKAGKFVGKAGVSAAKHVGKCALNPLQCSKKVGNSIRKGIAGISSWWANHRAVGKEARAREAAREARYEKHCQAKQLSWWACRKYKSTQEDMHDAKVKKAEAAVAAQIKAEDEAEKLAERAARQEHLRKLRG